MNRVLKEQTIADGITLQLVQGDITTEETEAIVNAANAHLQHGAGVAGAIVRRGGASVQRESDEWVRAHGVVTHERPAWTSGGHLRARYVIHAVGPVWGDGDEDAKLSSAVQGSLGVADELHCKSISMPALSTGIFGFPKDRAAHVMLAAIQEYFVHSESHIKVVRLVLFDQATAEAFLDAWELDTS